MLLMMATHGLGAAEILSLHLEDVDWELAILRVRRPKTAVHDRVASAVSDRQGIGKLPADRTSLSRSIATDILVGENSVHYLRWQGN